MKLNIPNSITICRIAASVVVFAMIGSYDYSAGWSKGLMEAAFVIFVATAFSDVLDGYLARKLKQVTHFGRIADPFVDKLLIIGSLIMLSSPAFTVQDNTVLESFSGNLPKWMYGNSISGLQPWMVVIIFARELMISAVRGYSESQGIEFPAIAAGKAKMLVQSIATGSILFCLAWGEKVVWANAVKLVFVWAAVLVTIFSGIIYMVKAKVFYAVSKKAEQGEGIDFNE